MAAHNQRKATTSGALIAAGKPGRNGGLAGIGYALAAIDGLSDASPRLHTEAMFEGASPLGVTALANRSSMAAVVPQRGTQSMLCTRWHRSAGYCDASKASSLAWASAWAAWVAATVPPEEVRASSVRLPYQPARPPMR